MKSEDAGSECRQNYVMWCPIGRRYVEIEVKMKYTINIKIRENMCISRYG